MAGWGSFHDFKPIKCPVCGTEFTPKSGAHKFCSPPCKGKWKYITGTGSTANQYTKISGNWSRYMARLRYFGGRKRELSTPFLMDLLRKQDYRCALSGRELTCILERGVVSLTNASIDRINAGGDYSEENIQLVCKALNYWRCNVTVEEFVDWCKSVAEFNSANSQRTVAGKGEDNHGQNA